MTNETKKGNKTMKKFEIGKTFTTRSICDQNCIFSITVESRTEKTIKTTTGETFRIAKKESEHFQAEAIFPNGRHSMAPIITAEKEIIS